MSWNKMPYWLKGGLIGLFVSIILGVIGLFTIYLSAVGYYYLNIWAVYLSNYCTTGESCIGTWAMISFFMSIIEFFIIGSLMGWIVGKLKSK